MTPMSIGAVDAILVHSQTGEPGDGKIFIIDLAEAIRVRTGERGTEVLAGASFRTRTADGNRTPCAAAPRPRSDESGRGRAPLATRVASVRVARQSIIRGEFP